MKKYIAACIACIIFTAVHAQDNDKYAYKPFSIYRTSAQVVIAGDLKTFVYANYTGNDVKRLNYTDAHAKPEYLVYELFKVMKNKNVDALKDLYDTSYRKEKFDAKQIETFMKDYSDIRFISKFRSGNLTIVRYNFTGAGNAIYPYFAIVQQYGTKYYLTTHINLSEPFNVIGSLSPSNLTQKTENAVATNNMTAFYFVRNADTVSFTTEKPSEEYSAIYLSIEKLSAGAGSPEKDFLEQLRNAAKITDETALKNMLSKDDQALLLKSEMYNNYFLKGIRKLFNNFQEVVPVAVIATDEGKIVYFKYSNPGENKHVSSVVLKKENNRYTLSLKIGNDDLNNVLQNLYVREALLQYLEKNM